MRLCGIETEYGLHVEGTGPEMQVAESARLVGCVPGPSFAVWDYGCETPRQDLRGFTAERLETDPLDAQWDPPEGRSDVRMDRVLQNGARFYNDHGHPEYATPECDRILDLVAHDLAGERIALSAARAYTTQTGKKATLYKNNSDYHGASYGTHENYSVERTVPVEALVRGLVPFFIARQVLFGAGKVGSEVGRNARYQISQRAEFLTETIGVDTLYRRPIFNTRDEPHADASKWIRLHVIGGDANRMQWANAMKVGMTSLVIDLIRDGICPEIPLSNPVRAMESVSKDESFTWCIETSRGAISAVDILEQLGECAVRYEKQNAETDWVLSEWKQAIADLREDPMRLRDRADWAAKLYLLNTFAAAENEWNQERMRSIELEYHNIDPEQSLFAAYCDSHAVRELVSDSRVVDAISTPPNTRAARRGEIVRSAKGQKAISWRRAVFQDRTEEL